MSKNITACNRGITKKINNNIVKRKITNVPKIEKNLFEAYGIRVSYTYMCQ